MKSQTKHTTETAQEQTQLSQAQTHPTSGREFASAEEALREDIRQTVVPPAIEHRLSKSIEKLPKPERPWWKRLLGD
jgi:hypothetical protein